MAESTSSFGVLTSLDAAYFEVDLKGVITHCNQAFLDKAETSSANAVGKHYRHLVASKQVADLFAAFNSIYETGNLRRVLFSFIRHHSGGFRTAEGVVGPIKNPSGVIIGFRGILFDVTERVKDEMEVLAAKQSAEKELAIGKNIQTSFLPSNLPKVDGWTLDVQFQSAREVAGDFYDVFPVSNGTRLGFVVADVCDKGVGAAMFMAIFRTLIRAFANVNTASNLTMAVEDNNDSLSKSTLLRRQNMLAVGAHPLINAITMTNQYIARNHGSSNMFATVFFGVLNPQDGKMLYVNAGHEPPLILSKGDIIKRLDPTGPAVGLMEELTFEIGSVDLSPGDLLMIYTDGVVDARNEKGESFTEDRLIEAVTRVENPEYASQWLMSRLTGHIASQDQFDDITLMGLFRKQ